MALRFLGIGSAYNTPLGNSNAFFFAGDDLVLLDCGETAFGALMARGLLTACRGDIYALITHLHADHAGSLPSLCSYCAGHLNKRVHVIHPSADVVTFLTLTGIPPSKYAYHAALSGLRPGLTARAIPVAHIPGYPSYGYLLTDAAGCVFFSGDCRAMPEEVLQGLLQGEIDRVYHDVQWQTLEEADACHLSFQALLRLVPPPYRTRVTCMHLNCDYRQMALDAGFAVATIDGL